MKLKSKTKTTVKTKKKPAHHHKRHGHHQKRSQRFHSVYWPYMPLVIAIIISIFISGIQPARGTLAYATEMSVGELLQATNNHRANNGAASLSLNTKLSNAAQAKANDMVARDYWSHNTPDGQEPWIFVDDAGYEYLKAGENLAYGFATSSDTVVGWMNSASHKANMLDTEFVEVGFGFTNSSNFNESGPQTVVVAMYGKPQTLAQTNQQTPAPTAPAPEETQNQASTAPAPEPEPAPAEPAAAAEAAEESGTATPTAKRVAFTTDTDGLSPVTNQVAIAKAQTLTGGLAPWSYFAAGALAGLGVMFMLIKHGLGLRRLIKDSEQFILHHPLLDSTLLGLIIIGITLSRTSGIIL